MDLVLQEKLKNDIIIDEVNVDDIDLDFSISLEKDIWKEIKKSIPCSIENYNIIIISDELCLEYHSNDNYHDIYHMPLCNMRIKEEDNIITLSIKNENDSKPFNRLIIDKILSILGHKYFLRKMNCMDYLEW